MLDLTIPNAFIFDLDGTLVDSEKFHVQALAGTMRELAGYELTAEDIEAFKGNTTRSLATELSEKYGWGLDIERAVTRKFELVYEIFQTDPFPGVAEFLDVWRGKVRFAVASNSPTHFVERVLRDLGVLDAVEVVCTVDDVTRRKPDPEMLHLVLTRLGLPPEQTLVFEDSLPGVQAALAAKCPVLIVDTPASIEAGAPPPGLPVATWPELVHASQCLLGERPCSDNS
jgi:HAD superfamily hydrolase (TIGR01509 family)